MIFSKGDPGEHIEIFRQDASGDLTICGVKELQMFNNLIIQAWQAGDDVFIDKAEFIKPKDGV